MKSFRNIRVLPVVLVAIFGLAVLKVAGLVIDGGYVFDYRPESTKPSWAQETFNFPGRRSVDSTDITGSVKEKPKEEEGKPAPDVEKAEATRTLRSGRRWQALRASSIPLRPPGSASGAGTPRSPGIGCGLSGPITCGHSISS